MMMKSTQVPLWGISPTTPSTYLVISFPCLSSGLLHSSHLMYPSVHSALHCYTPSPASMYHHFLLEHYILEQGAHLRITIMETLLAASRYPIGPAAVVEVDAWVLFPDTHRMAPNGGLECMDHLSPGLAGGLHVLVFPIL